MRGVSTVVDATVFLLLVSGAVATLLAGSAPPPSETGNPAGEDADLLATSTATIEYSLSPEPGQSETEFHGRDGGDFRRSAHGTLASLLADAVLSNATFRGSKLSGTGEAFEREVTETVRTHLARPSVGTSVEATWVPYSGSFLSGTVDIGDDPPRDADVNAATTTVASGVPTATVRPDGESPSDGYDGVSRAVASAVVRGFFPARETELALRGPHPIDSLTADRYRRAARLFDAGALGLPGTDTEAANDRLIDALAARIRVDLADRFESPDDAAAAVDTTTVRITVRTWSP